MATFELKGKYTDGTDWTAGTFEVPTSLPNYVNLEKPTSVSVNESGSEVTYSGVAEFESGGAMESGEFHEVKESPLVFLQVGTNTNAVVGGTVLMVNSWFNRTPYLNEKCYFITTQPDSTKVAWTGKCIQIDGDSCRFQVFLVTQLGGGAKKYLHRIKIYGIISNITYKITLNFVCGRSSVFIISGDFSTYLHENGLDDVSIPCNGYMQNGNSDSTKMVLQFFNEIKYATSVYNTIVASGYLINLENSIINEGSVTGIPTNLGITDNVIEL